MKIQKILCTVVLVTLAFQGYAFNGVGHDEAEGSQTVPPGVRDSAPGRMTEQIASAQVPFIVNQGQVDEQVKFYAHTFSGIVFVTRTGDIVYSLPEKGKEGRSLALRERVVSSKTPDIEGLSEASTRISYFKGNDAGKWRTGLPTFNELSFGNVYQNIGLKLKAHGNNVEKLFYVQAGGDAGEIQLQLNGTEELLVGTDGELQVKTALGNVTFSRPIAFQETNGKRNYVKVAYSVNNDTYGFTVGPYDHSRELVIDPTLASTFIGGSGDENAHLIRFDSGGDLYVSSTTASLDFPVTFGAYNVAHNGGNIDVYIARLDADLSSVLAATYFGGSGDDYVGGVEFDSSGNVLIAGKTKSSDIPTTAGAYQIAKSTQIVDFYVAKLDANLNSVLESTYVGGIGGNLGGTLFKIDSTDNVVLASYVLGTSFPTTPGAYDTTHNDYDYAKNHGDVGIVKLNSNLSILLAGTYIGSGLWDVPYDLHIDAADNIYVVGRTSPSSWYGAMYPTTPGAYAACSNHAWSTEGFISKFSSDLSTLLASTCIGQYAKTDIIWGITAAPDGSVYVTGNTTSPGFPTSPGAFDATYSGGPGAPPNYWFGDGFVTRFDAGLSTVIASTYLGGTGRDRPLGITVDGSGDVHVAGLTDSPNFPITPDGLQTAYNGGVWDGFYARLDGALTSLQYGTYIGGLDLDIVYSPAMNAAGEVYLSGYTASPDFLTTVGAYDTTHNGGTDGYIMRVGVIGPTDTTPPTGTITINGGANLTGSANVVLSLSCDDGTGSGCSEMQFSNDGATFSVPQPFVSSTNWILAAGADGLSTVTVRYIDADGNISTGVISDSITLDTSAPVITASLDPFVSDDDSSDNNSDSDDGSGDSDDGSRDSDDDSSGPDDGLLIVQYSATDNIDTQPLVTAELIIVGYGAPISVSNGQIIKFEYEDDETEVEVEDGVLEIEAPGMLLRVTATDAVGNSAVVEVQAQNLDEDSDD